MSSTDTISQAPDTSTTIRLPSIVWTCPLQRRPLVKPLAKSPTAGVLVVSCQPDDSRNPATAPAYSRACESISSFSFVVVAQCTAVHCFVNRSQVLQNKVWSGLFLLDFCTPSTLASALQVREDSDGVRSRQARKRATVETRKSMPPATAWAISESVPSSWPKRTSTSD